MGLIETVLGKDETPKPGVRNYKTFTNSYKDASKDADLAGKYDWGNTRTLQANTPDIDKWGDKANTSKEEAVAAAKAYSEKAAKDRDNVFSKLGGGKLDTGITQQAYDITPTQGQLLNDKGSNQALYAMRQQLDSQAGSVDRQQALAQDALNRFQNNYGSQGQGQLQRANQAGANAQIALDRSGRSAADQAKARVQLANLATRGRTASGDLAYSESMQNAQLASQAQLLAAKGQQNLAGAYGTYGSTQANLAAAKTKAYQDAQTQNANRWKQVDDARLDLGKQDINQNRQALEQLNKRIEAQKYAAEQLKKGAAYDVGNYNTQRQRDLSVEKLKNQEWLRQQMVKDRIAYGDAKVKQDAQLGYMTASYDVDRANREAGRKFDQSLIKMGTNATAKTLDWLTSKPKDSGANTPPPNNGPKPFDFNDAEEGDY